MLRTTLAALALATMPKLLSGCSSVTGKDCCKTCSDGKACGDGCIAKNDVCNKGAGCACNE